MSDNSAAILSNNLIYSAIIFYTLAFSAKFSKYTLSDILVYFNPLSKSHAKLSEKLKKKKKVIFRKKKNRIFHKL